MTCGRAERVRICTEMGRSLRLLRATLTAAETKTLSGAPDTPALLNLVDNAASTIAQLEPAHDILTYFKTHGPEPYAPEVLTKAVPQPQDTVEQVTSNSPLRAFSIYATPNSRLAVVALGVCGVRGEMLRRRVGQDRPVQMLHRIDKSRV